MIKKLAVVIILSIIPIFCKSQIQETRIALELFRQGYIHHSFETLKKIATSKNDGWAQFYVAQCYEQGFGVEANVASAFSFYRRAAEKGLAVSQIALANYYENGYGVQQNEDKAEFWRNKAQDKYNPEDLVYLYNLYQDALNHPENYAMNPNSIPSGEENRLAQQSETSSKTNNNQTINHITINVQPEKTLSHTLNTAQHRSDIDKNIPHTSHKNEHTFAIIIANENYHDVAKVPNALNDGEVFTEYCKKCLGLPSSNVRLVKDATLNNIKREVNQLKQIAEAYKGEAKFIFYYAGHGIPDEATKDAYLLPVDGYGTDISTGYSLNQLYKELGELKSEQVIVLLDACFSGTQRGNGMLATARGVAIKAKPSDPLGKMAVLSAAQGDETAYPFEEQHHGLFTYYLLKKLKDTKGTVSMGELADYIKDNVSKKSIVANGKSQTPTVSASAAVGESWKTWKLNQ